MFSNYLVAIYEGYQTKTKYPLTKVRKAFDLGLIKVKGDTRQGITQELIDKAKVEALFIPDLPYSLKQKEDLIRYIMNNTNQINDTGNKKENIEDVKSVLKKIPVDELDDMLRFDWDGLREEVIGSKEMETKYDQLFVKHQRAGADISEVQSVGEYIAYKFDGGERPTDETIKAVMDFACESGWCVKNEVHAKGYLKEGNLYLVLKDNKRVALVNFETDSFMDVYDKPIKRELALDITASFPEMRKRAIQKEKWRYVKLTEEEEDKYIETLIAAAAAGSLRLVKKFLEEDDTVILKDRKKGVRRSKNRALGPHRFNIAFIKSVRNNDIEITKVLLDDGRVHPGYSANEAIKVAAIDGNVEMAKLLLKDPRTNPGEDDDEALYAAAANGQKSIVRLLLDDNRIKFDNEEVNVETFEVAVKKGHEDIAMMLYNDDRVQDVWDDWLSWIIIPDTYRWAGRNGMLRVLEVLIDDGTNHKQVLAALDAAVRGNHAAAVRKILQLAPKIKTHELLSTKTKGFIKDNL